MPNATEMKKGMVIKHEGDLWRCMDTQHVTPGNWRGMVQSVLRNLRTGAKHEMRFRSTDKIEPVFVETGEFQYLFRERNLYTFMNTETYDQVTVDEDAIGDGKNFLVENTNVQMQLHEGVPIGIDLPASVVLKIVETTPGVRGDTVTNTRKEATLETGLVVKVPLFVEQGSKVRVDTRTGEFMERAND
ncbi:MAG: Elongation factor P [Planctomycetes bacterium]|nr:Elongation factor P [Planctomycetota bacterium]